MLLVAVVFVKLIVVSEEESKQSKSNFSTQSWHQKTCLVKASVIDWESEPADHVDGHDGDHDEALIQYS